ncbi:cell wall-binding repeat-containing protein [Desulfosporosinus sp. PR]|uniref:cell wall-binding repeat-containing protein n=1 Tax=Candidatus Desulfosporosinus nitrosoreducens TaxID=3401928 RepID=UPI0027EB89B5|nr:cell wall-binding repeat-containing protein [Desulfosporosinus sp. PR]MDQ7095666.1 cell wall-binding repeat-containing protein [Desulfosporosinus sp. PR]
MNKNILVLILCCGIFLGTPSFAAADNLDPASSPPSIINVNRIFGQTKYETAKAISESYSAGKVKCVFLATGEDFADALSASVLAYEKKAPILLVDTSVAGSKDAFSYIAEHLESAGTVYIIGGRGIIGQEFDAKLNDLGFQNVVRIAGMDRYDTSYMIAASLQDEPLSTVVISSGEQYPDALSISSFAANKGWPILLSPYDALPREMENFLQEKKPSKVIIAGGTGIISDHIKSQISGLLPQASIQRLTGQSRFDTNVVIAETFAPNPATVYLATGYSFADALAGSALAAEQRNPIIFIDPAEQTLPESAASYFERLYDNKVCPNLVSLGGSGVVSDDVMKNSSDLILGKVKGTSIYSISDITAAVTQNESYSLPATVQAKLYNSETIDLPVQWNSKVANTSKVGSNVYEGTVNGYGKIIKLTLTVKEPMPIAQYSTQFDATLVNRTENLCLAAKALNGKLLAPGERFSFNKSVGERTAEAGYKEALIIEGNTFTPGLGGGVCQVSSTLYNAVVLAHLEVLERHPHTLPVGYVPSGQDATVAYPVLDFKFRNSTDSYLLIRSLIEGNTLTFQLYKKTGN